MQVRILGPGDDSLLADLAAGVFDTGIQAGFLSEFLQDPRHHLAVAIDKAVVVGFASAVHYVHPDKRPELWINQVGVAPTHQRQGLGRQLMQALFDVGRRLGCREAWVLTEQTNQPAVGLYASLGGVDSPAVMFTFKL